MREGGREGGREKCEGEGEEERERGEREREERNANLTPLSEHGCEVSCPVTPASV